MAHLVLAVTTVTLGSEVLPFNVILGHQIKTPQDMVVLVVLDIIHLAVTVGMVAVFRNLTVIPALD